MQGSCRKLAGTGSSQLNPTVGRGQKAPKSFIRSHSHCLCQAFLCFPGRLMTLDPFPTVPPCLQTCFLPGTGQMGRGGEEEAGKISLLVILATRWVEGGSAVFQSNIWDCIRDLAWITELKHVGTVKDKICREGKAFVAEMLWKRTRWLSGVMCRWGAYLIGGRKGSGKAAFCGCLCVGCFCL